jgi:hypothetical protein
MRLHEPKFRVGKDWAGGVEANLAACAWGDISQG